MKVIFAQSANAIHFTSFGSSPEEGWCCTDLRSPCLNTSSGLQTLLGGKASLPPALGCHSPGMGNCHQSQLQETTAELQQGPAEGTAVPKGPRAPHPMAGLPPVPWDWPQPHTHLGAQPPFPGVGVSLHDHSLDLCHHAVVTGGNDSCGHQGNGCRSRHGGQ